MLYSLNISTGSKPRPPVLHVTAVSHVNFLFSFFHKKDISWVIIRIEIKMKSSALLPSNLPRVIDRSNLSLSREFASCHRLITFITSPLRGSVINLIGR